MAAETPAITQEADAEVESLLLEGAELRRAGKDAEALELIEQARVKLPTSTRVLAHLAAAYQALGRWLEAEQLLRDLLGMTDDPYVERHGVTLKKSYEFVSQRVGKLDVAGEPPGAEVLLSGRSVGTLPLSEPVSVAAGSYTLEVRLEGYHLVSRSIAVAGGAFVRETVQLRPRDLAKGRREVSPGAADAPGPHAASDGPSWMTWTLAGLGTAATVTGAAFWWNRERHISRWNSDDCLAPQLTRGDVCSGERDAAQRSERFALTSGIVAGALLGGAAVTFFILDESPAGAGVQLTSCGLGLRSATCSASF